MNVSGEDNVTGILKNTLPFDASIASNASTASNASKAPLPLRKVLIITYYWPPSGGAGVQRWLKFSKYLPEFGWQPVILTVDPEYAAYPVTDLSLVTELPESVKVYKTPSINYFSFYNKNKSNIPSAGFANNLDNTLRGKFLRFVRGNFFLPDPRRGWNRYAFNKACELIEHEDIKNIITTSPPHSTQLIGLKLKKKFPSVKWTADLRDPWTDIYYYKQFYPTILSKALDLNFEKNVLKKADTITTVGPSLKALFSSKLKGLENKIEVITNGYDESDFKDISRKTPARFTITYVGTLSDIYPVEGLIAAVNNLDLLLRFVGNISEKTRIMLEENIPAESLEFLPYVTHDESVKFMMNSSLLLLIIPLHQSNKSIITGKLFEYLATGLPILCLGPVNGDASEIIKKCSAGQTFIYFDSEKISGFLLDTMKHPFVSDEPSVKSFSRLNLVRQIAEILDHNNFD
jgi:glycosyltransferase involved in cell wall biosynthesis